MKELLTYLNGLPTREAQEEFARSCETTIGYLRKAAYKDQKIGDSICVLMEKHSGGVLLCETLRPDVSWHRIEDKDWPHPAGRPLIDHAVKAAA